ICFKYHAACYLTHSAIEATRQLCQSNAFDPNDIEDIEVQVDQGHLRVCNILEPDTGLEAKFSLRLTVAMAICDEDSASISVFDDALTRDPDIVRFRDKVRVLPHTQPRPETVVQIRTRTGEEYEAAVNVAIPMRDLDAQWAKLESKFSTLSSPVIGEAATRRVVQACRSLEEVADIGDFSQQLRTVS
ncbi:MAG: hypothetical protein ACC642_08860, partial [Pseudomonadales bacterium]